MEIGLPEHHISFDEQKKRSIGHHCIKAECDLDGLLPGFSTESLIACLIAIE